MQRHYSRKVNQSKGAQNTVPLVTWNSYTIFSDIFGPHEYMGVSKNRGTSKSSILMGVFPYKPSMLGYQNFRKHPYTANKKQTSPLTYLQRSSWALEGRPSPTPDSKPHAFPVEACISWAVFCMMWDMLPNDFVSQLTRRLWSEWSGSRHRGDTSTTLDEPAIPKT